MRIKIFTALALCLMLLSGCASGEGVGEDSSTDSTSSEVTSSEETMTTVGTVACEADEEPAELYILRRELKSADCTLGIAFIDYSDYTLSSKEALEQLKDSDFFEEYPFFLECELVDCGGEMLFALVPRREGEITLYSSSINEDGELETDRSAAIYVGKPGEPLLVRCNMSDAFSNVLVSVDGIEFGPQVTMEDGWTLYLQDGCYDFSLDDIRKYNYAGYLLVRDYFEQEVEEDQISYLGTIELMGITMLHYGVSEYNDEGELELVRRYAVGFDALFVLDHREWILREIGIRDML